MFKLSYLLKFSYGNSPTSMLIVTWEI